MGNVKCHVKYSNIGSSVLGPAEPVKNFELHQKQKQIICLGKCIFLPQKN